MCLTKVDNMPFASGQLTIRVDLFKSKVAHCLDIVVELSFLLREGIEEGVGEG